MSSYQPKSVTSSKRAWPETPGVVDEDVERAVLARGFLDEMPAVHLGADVAADGERLGAARAAVGGYRLQLLQVARREREPDVLAGHLAREFGADTFGGARDGDDLAGEHPYWRANFCTRRPKPTSAV